jgi:HK97 family phage portal protein
MTTAPISPDQYRVASLERQLARARAGEGPRADGSRVVSIQRPEDWGSNDGTVAGICVNDQSAMRLSAFYACVRLIASTIGSLPLQVFRPGVGGAAEPARDAQLYKVLHDSPNADQTPTDYWETAILSILLRGNHYARKLTAAGGRLIALDPIRPDIVQTYRRADGKIGYRWSWDGKSYDEDESTVFHLRGFGGGPMGGLSTLTYARETLGIAIAADRAAGAMFANGVRPSGALQAKEWLATDKRDEQRALIEEKFVGSINTGRPFLLEGGMTWQQVSMNADDAQLLESRGWSVEEICRWFLVPPILIGHSEKTTSWGSGIEQLLLGFLKFTLNPYLRRAKQAIWKQLMTPAERAAGLFVEFNLEGLLAADSQGRANFYQKMTSIGAYTINEVRAKENLPPVEGGDVPRIQIQNAPIDQADANLGGGQ